MPKKTNRHHVVPKRLRKTIKDDENIVMLDINFHCNYHSLFEDLSVDEVITMIRIITETGTFWDSKKIYNLRKSIKKGL